MKGRKIVAEPHFTKIESAIQDFLILLQAMLAFSYSSRAGH